MADKIIKFPEKSCPGCRRRKWPDRHMGAEVITEKTRRDKLRDKIWPKVQELRNEIERLYESVGL